MVMYLTVFLIIWGTSSGSPTKRINNFQILISKKIFGVDYEYPHFTDLDFVLFRTLPVIRQMMAGGLAGFCQIIITTPMELLKIQMQDAGRVAAAAKSGNIVFSINMLQMKCFLLAGKTIPKTTATKIALELFKKHGILGLYKGIGATMLRDVSFSVVYFPLFATLNDLGPRKNDGSGKIASLKF